MNIKKNLKNGKNYRDLSLEKTHLASDDVNYQKFISQKNRILNKKNYYKITNLDFFKKIKQMFGPFKHVSNGPFAKNFGQFVIRIVRPAKFKSDIGSIHADIWFFLLNKHKNYYFMEEQIIELEKLEFH